MNELRQAIMDAADEPSEEEVVDESVEDKGIEAEAAVEASSSEAGDDTETTLTEESNDPEVTSTAEPEVTTEAADKPPLGWSPANREHWGKLDPSVKQQISKREREVEEVLRTSAESRKLADTFNSTINPYKAMMAAEGAGDPMQAVTGLLNTAAMLKMGTPEQKAQRISQLIQHYGVDIETLDTVLSGQIPQNAPEDAVQRAINERLAPMEQMFSTFKERQQSSMQENQSKVDNEISSFGAKAEFFNDVRLDMADVLDMAAKRGINMTLQQAYDKACNLHPEISGVIAQRKQQNDLGIKKKTSNSLLNGTLGGEVNNSAHNSLRDALESAWSGDS